jgi:argininosuccinate lyase
LSATAVGEASRTGHKGRFPAPNDRQTASFAPPFTLTHRKNNSFAMADLKPPHDAAATGGWSGRFGEPVSDRVKRYTASVDFDCRLADADIAGSLAHARMLATVGVLAADDLEAIRRGMATIRGEIARGEFPWSRDLEDVHFNIEKRLTALVGDAGKRLHTGRSRNDQVATDLRLWLRDEIDELVAGLAALRRGFIDLADRHAATIMPGYTHLQVAQPVTFGHHLLAYEAMFARDAERFRDCRRRVNRLPLGSAALAGTSFPIDRAMVAKELGFEALCNNSLDAVSDRDFAIEFTAAAAMTMTHVSRFAEELAWWVNPRFAFVSLADRYCTGSSIMPQKRNPDVAELARGKTGRVTGHLVALLTLMKGQPLAYNRDNQEDKEPLFDTVDTVADTLAIMAELVATGIAVDAARMREAAAEGFATATDLADYLVRKGVPFRDAHEAVARAVRHADEHGSDLAALPLAELRSFAREIGDDVFAVLTLEGSVASRDHPGGTAPAQVRAAIIAARSALDAESASTCPSRQSPCADSGASTKV